jgi:phage-related protein
MRTVIFYQTPSGRAPALEFLTALGPKQRKKIALLLESVERDQRVAAKYMKKLAGTGGLWELRAAYGGDAFRLLGFFDGPMLMVVVSGFMKKTEHIPIPEIALAEQRRRDYLRRKEQAS